MKRIIAKLHQNANSKTQFYDISARSRLLGPLNARARPDLEAFSYYLSGGVADRSDEINPDSMKMQRLVAQQRQEGTRNLVTLEEILGNFTEGHISFVGVAGSGKTTLLKEITQRILSGKCENLKDIKVVHFANIRSFSRHDSVTPGELLFRNVEPPLSDSEIQKAMKFAKENPSKVLFIIDSLDTVPYQVDGVYKSITLEECSSPEDALSSILSDKLLKGCRFITSTREHTIRNYKGSLRPQLVIALAGFSKASRRKIVVGYFGEVEANEFMGFVETKPILEALCATPVWLIFTLMVWRSKTNDRPTTMAGILSVLLDTMIRSEHTHEEGIEEVVKKLTHMAFTGTKEHRVLFSTDELAQYKLNAVEVTDLVVIIPGGLQQKILLGSDILYYCHQSLQEQLTSFHAARLPLIEFTVFVHSMIYEPHYAVVKSLLSGILLNEKVFQQSSNFLAGGSDYEAKKAQLKESLLHQLKSTQDKRDLLQLYSALSEAGNSVKDIIQRNVHDVSFVDIALSPIEAYSIGWVMTQQNVINKLDMRGSPLSHAAATALQNGIGNSSVLMKSLAIEVTGPDSLSVIGQIVKRNVENLWVWSERSLVCRLDIKRTAEEETEDKISFLSTYGAKDRSINAREIQMLLAPLKGMKISKMYAKDYFKLDDDYEIAKRKELVLQIAESHGVDFFRIGPYDMEKISSEPLKNIKELEIHAGEYFKHFKKDDELNKKISLIGEVVNKCWPVTYISMGMSDFLVADSNALNMALAGAKELKIYAGGYFQYAKDDGDLMRRILFVGGTINKYATDICISIKLNDLTIADSAAFKMALDGAKMHSISLQCDITSARRFPVEVLCEFLPLVASEIDLKGFELNPDEIQGLQHELDKTENKALKIVFGKRTPYKLLQSKSFQKLPAVTKIKAHRSNGGVVVTWHNPLNDPDTRFHVETFCGNESMKDIHTVEEPRYEKVLPMPSRIYHFKVWPENACGIKGDAAYSNLVVTCPSPVQSVQLEIVYNRAFLHETICYYQADVYHTDFEVDEHESLIEVGGCKIMLPPQTFTKTCAVHVREDTIMQLWPEMYFPISPTLHFDPEMPLSKEATVQMTTWCVLSAHAIPGSVNVDVLHEENNKWEVIERVSMTNSRMVKFKNMCFSPIQLAIKKSLCREEVSVIVTGQLHYTGQSEVTLSFFLDDKNLKEKYKRKTGKFIRDLNPMVFENDQEVSVAMRSVGKWQSVDIISPTETAFKIDTNVLTMDRIYTFSFAVQQSTTEDHCDLPILMYSVKGNDKVVGNNEQPFEYNKQHAMETGRDDEDKPDLSLYTADLLLLRDQKSIKASWDKIADENVVYLIHLYCNCALVNKVPYITKKNSLTFPCQPAKEYFCEVWARNSCGVDGPKRWSDVIEMREMKQSEIKMKEEDEPQSSNKENCKSETTVKSPLTPNEGQYRSIESSTVATFNVPKVLTGKNI